MTHTLVGLVSLKSTLAFGKRSDFMKTGVDRIARFRASKAAFGVGLGRLVATGLLCGSVCVALIAPQPTSRLPNKTMRLSLRSRAYDTYSDSGQ